MTSETYHEPHELLTEPTKDFHRAIVSLMEELEAIDWYNQRAQVTTDDSLRAVLEHNRDEEIEHAMMTLEWLRRNNVKFDANIRTYLLTTAPITEVEAGETPGESAETNVGTTPKASIPVDGSLGIGSLKRNAP